MSSYSTPTYPVYAVPSVQPQENIYQPQISNSQLQYSSGTGSIVNPYPVEVTVAPSLPLVTTLNQPVLMSQNEPVSSLNQGMPVSM